MADMLLQKDVDKSLKSWRKKEKTALELLTLVGELRFDRAIELILFRQDIYDARPSEVINAHQYSTNYTDSSIDVNMSLSIAKAITQIKLAPARIDIGKLALNWLKEDGYTADLDEFVRNQLSNLGNEGDGVLESKDVILYGFGRIGRLLTRRLVAQTGSGDQLRLKAIVLRAKLKDRKLELEKRATLLRTDSVHGTFKGNVVVDHENDTLIINGNRVKVIFANSPSDIDYTTYGISIFHI